MLPKDKLVAAAAGIPSPGWVFTGDANLHQLVRPLGSGIAQKVKKPDYLVVALSLGRTVQGRPSDFRFSMFVVVHVRASDCLNI